MRYSTAIVAALVSVAAANPAGMIERDSPIAHYAPVAGRGLPHNRTGILPGPVKNLKNSNTTVDPDGRKAEDTRRGLTHSHTGIIPIPAKDLKNGSTTVDPDVEKAEDTRRGLTHSHTGIIPIPAKDLKNGNTTVDPDMAAAENTRREALADAGQGGPEELERRNSATSGITDCGSRHDTLDSGWVPVDDRPGPDNVQLIGYNTAKDEFCYHATHTYDGEDTVITHGQAYSDQINGITLTKGNYGHITFIIENTQQTGTITIDEAYCQQWLGKVAEEKNSCWGKNNRDTKGGTYYLAGSGNWKSMPGTGGS